jgi:hypothetical protein
MKTVEELTAFQDAMREKMTLHAKELGFDTEKRVEPIWDGVCDIEKYCSSSPKIMWILKEGYDNYDENGALGGGFDVYGDWKNPEKFDNVMEIKTWRPMMYIMNGIASGEKWDDMDWVWDDPNMLALLAGSAYINASKMPGFTRSGNMYDKFNQWKEIVLEQIDAYEPDVIIFGGTLDLLWETEVCDCGEAHVLEGIAKIADAYKNKKGQILIDAYHPGQTKLKQSVYVDSIVSLVRKYTKQH